MDMYSIITRKKRGLPLSAEEIAYFVGGYAKGEIPDYQISALLMAICLNGMEAGETAVMTRAMAESGDMLDLSPLVRGGVLPVDKHSTGGVGDKATLVIAPLVAACGGIVAKMSGRGLGHTGGTIDKLESIKGYRAALSPAEFFATVEKIGLSVVEGSASLAPADKKLYALRDATATVDSLPLIAASVMSKKLASGAKAIVLDVKAGSGAFMKTAEAAAELAAAMVAIGESHGRRMAALVTDMDTPLGHSIGNALEVREAVAVLNGGGPEDLREVSLELAAEMLSISNAYGDYEAARRAAEAALKDYSALHKLAAMVKAHGGDENMVYDTAKLPISPCRYELPAERAGYVARTDTEKIGRASVLLGAGRQKKGDPIDYGAGLIIRKKRGDYVEKGESLATFYTAKPGLFEDAAAVYREAVTFSEEKVEKTPLVLQKISGGKGN